MKWQSLIGFNGINRQVSPFLAEVGELSESQNYITEKIGVLKKSFDYTIKGAQIVDNASIYGGVDFFRNDGTHEHFVAVNSGTETEIYKYVTDTWTSQDQNLTKDYRVRFAYSPTIDTLFACNYIDATRSFNGTTWSTATNVTDAPKAKYIISFGDRIYLLNCKIDATSYPSRAYRSNAIETSLTWDVTEGTGEYVVFEDVITGVGINGQNMFIGCQGSTHIFTLSDERIKMSTIGCVSHEGIVTQGQYTFYPSFDGYYGFDGKNTFKVSSQIQEYWDKIPAANYESIHATRKGGHIYIYIGDITAPWDSSETLQNVVFDFNVAQNNWSRGKLGNDCTSLHMIIDTYGETVYMGDDDGNVYEMFDDSGQQNGSDYSSFVETNWEYGSGAGVVDDFRSFVGYGKYLSGLKVSYKTEDLDSWHDLGSIDNDVGVLNFRPIRSYKIKFRLAEYSGKNLFELYRFDIGYSPAYEKDADREG